MNFKLPASFEFRLPSDELIRIPYKLPSWWDKPVKWKRGDNQKENHGGRPKTGEPTLKDKIVETLKGEWKTSKEIAEILGCNPKSISESLRTGTEIGRFARRVRSGVEYEYAYKK
jgi:hypothetical protein